MAIADELKTLQDLHDKGNLTDQEFASAKAQALGGRPQRKPSRTGTWVLLFILLALILVVWNQIGSRGAKSMVATVVHAPIQVKDEVQSVPADSYKAMPFSLPYTGNVTLTLSVVHGNPMDVFVTNTDQLASLQAKDWQNLRTYTDFNALKTQTYGRTARLQQGSYYLVLRDTSLGILSSSASDIAVKLELQP